MKGADGACMNVDLAIAENEWSLWGTAGHATTPAVVTPFYVVHYHWPNFPDQTAYYIPAAGKVRQIGDDGGGLWYDLHDPRALRTSTRENVMRSQRGSLTGQS
jgi:hypothetical protein